MIAKDKRKTFRLSETLFPMISRTASEKAISVAVGMAHPDMFSGLLILIRIYINAGAAIPPTAAMAAGPFDQNLIIHPRVFL